METANHTYLCIQCTLAVPFSIVASRQLHPFCSLLYQTLGRSIHSHSLARTSVTCVTCMHQSQPRHNIHINVEGCSLAHDMPANYIASSRNTFWPVQSAQHLQTISFLAWISHHESTVFTSNLHGLSFYTSTQHTHKIKHGYFYVAQR